jgi:uncharacterized membrane protein
MKPLTVIVILACLASVYAGAQETQAPQAASITASLNKSLGVYVFPGKDQKPDQQAADEQACYSWAIQQSGVDPLNMTPTTPQAVDKGPDGSVVAGATMGAIGGAVIGGIVHPHYNAGGAAAMGAMVGGMKGAATKAKKDAQKEQQAKQSAAAADQAKIDSFKRAYSACLEGKGYTVK